jgi:carbonic anhydrase
MKGYVILFVCVLKTILAGDAPAAAGSSATVSGSSAYPLASYPPYDYTESDWPRTCKVGLSQTPIDIPKLGSNKITVTKDVLQLVSFNYKPITGPVFKNYYNTKFGMNVTGFGSLTVIKNNITYTYNLADLHIHVLSEHTFDGMNTELEMHLVHYKDNTPFTSQNITDPDASNIALVVGLLFKVSDDALNINIQKLNAATSSPVQELDLSSYVQPSRNYFHYSGGLTTPGCVEVVNWVVMQKLEYMSPAQFEDFKKLILPLYPTGNGRLTKPLYGRPIYFIQNNNDLSGSFLKYSMFILLTFVLLLH